MDLLQARTHRDALPAGAVLNGYRIMGVLGRGGFGITYRATDLLDQSFAIKEFFPRQFAVRAALDVIAASDSDESLFIDCRGRFLTEARLLANLGRSGSTPGVVRVVTFFEANNTAYFVMELLAGKTLDEVLRAQGSLSARELESVLRGILEPLVKVHTAGFLHRDIKPSNILIRPDGQPVLIDFGSARHWGPSSEATYTQVYSGNYAPIEQMIHGAPQGPYSDIYAVGGVAYRAIGGTLVDARSRHQALLSQSSDPLAPAADVGRGRYPDFVLRIVDRALAVTAEERPQQAEEVLAALDADATVRHSRPMAPSHGPLRADGQDRTYRNNTSMRRASPSAATSRASRVPAMLQHLFRWRPASKQSVQADGSLRRRYGLEAAIPIAGVAVAALLGTLLYNWVYTQNEPLSGARVDSASQQAMAPPAIPAVPSQASPAPSPPPSEVVALAQPVEAPQNLNSVEPPPPAAAPSNVVPTPNTGAAEPSSSTFAMPATPLPPAPVSKPPPEPPRPNKPVLSSNTATIKPMPLPPKGPGAPAERTTTQVAPAPAKPVPQDVAAVAPVVPAPRQPRDEAPQVTGEEMFRRGYAAYSLQNYAEARKLYLVGAAKGNANCMYSLGLLYAEGLGVGRDLTEAQSWYEKAANKGYVNGFYSIGLLYLQDGQNRRRDCNTARHWFSIAAEHGSSPAREWLAANRSCS